MIENILNDFNIKFRHDIGRCKFYSDDDYTIFCIMSDDMLIMTKYNEPSKQFNRSVYDADDRLILTKEYMISVLVKEFLIKNVRIG